MSTVAHTVGPLEAGDTCGQYEIVREHARGGMAIIYQAVSCQGGERRAIKVMQPSGKGYTEKQVERFLQEIAAVRVIVSDRVVTFYDAGTKDGVLWLAMEFLEGETLAVHIARKGGRFTITAILQMALQLARGLRAIHKHRIIHRDLKPKNIIINAAGDLKIFDFGIAKYDGRFTTTQPGTTPITAAYMSPEQAAGSDQLDARSDIFNWGLVVQELVTGSHVFTSMPGGMATVGDMFARIMNCNIARLTSTECVNEGLAALIHRALAQTPQHRFANAAELEHALVEVVTKERQRTDVPSSTKRRCQRSGTPLRLVENLSPEHWHVPPHPLGGTAPMPQDAVPMPQDAVLMRRDALRLSESLVASAPLPLLGAAQQAPAGGSGRWRMVGAGAVVSLLATVPATWMASAAYHQPAHTAVDAPPIQTAPVAACAPLATSLSLARAPAPAPVPSPTPPPSPRPAPAPQALRPVRARPTVTRAAAAPSSTSAAKQKEPSTPWRDHGF